MNTRMPFEPTAWPRFPLALSSLATSAARGAVCSWLPTGRAPPSASLPHQLRSPKALKPSSRLLTEPAVTPAKLRAPHLHHTTGLAGAVDLVVVVQETTTLSSTHHPTTQGLGPLEPYAGQGLFLPTALAVLRQPRQVMGAGLEDAVARLAVYSNLAGGSPSCSTPLRSEMWVKVRTHQRGLSGQLQRSVPLSREVRGLPILVVQHYRSIVANAPMLHSH